MPELPSGTVTFLFTDIEGSTRLLERLGTEAYAQALASHRTVIRAACSVEGGVEVDTEGDAFFVAFPTAQGALAAAAAFSEGLAQGPIRVRVGLHTGTPLLAEDNYVGMDVHRAARIAASGHGGQVLVSATTAALTGTEGLRELGEHRLKDFAEPIALYQLGDGSFAPLKTISNTNLPRPASSFVGRAREVEDVLVHLRDGARLLTLTGPGGSGKSRLAVEAAGELVPDYKAGVFWVGLAPVRDPALVAGTIGRTIGAQGALAEHVGERELLLVLDNLEQVVGVAPELASLLEACPNLRLLVTSRELLRVRGEVEYPVEPLADPDAVELFCVRARAEPGPAVAELCRALDNLPLALELAAARSAVLSPTQILERLSDRLDLFKGGRDADPRQQTLRATIEWSYELLDAEEQRIFARLAVFRRGCTLEAAQDIAQASLDVLQSLVEKGLVRHTDERFWMLETIREFAAERLRDSRELGETARRHAEHFRAFATSASAELVGTRPGEMLERVEEDLENVRSAVRWSAEEADVDTALSIVVSLERFWSARGCPADFLALVEAALEQAGESIDEELRAQAAWVAGFQVVRAGELERAARLYEQSLGLFRRLGKRFEALRCLSELAIVRQEQGREAEASGLAEEALATAQELGEPRAIAAAATCRATVAYARADFALAAELYEEALRVNRQDSDRPGPIASSLYNIGLAARALGDYDRAERALREALEVATRSGNAVFIGNSAVGLGYVMLARDDLASARSWGRQGLKVVGELGNPAWTAPALGLSAAINVGAGDARSAARLWGAVDALLEGAELSVEADDERARKTFEGRARSALGTTRFADAAEEGRRMPVEEALQLALDTIGPDTARGP